MPLNTLRKSSFGCQSEPSLVIPSPIRFAQGKLFAGCHSDPERSEGEESLLFRAQGKLREESLFCVENRSEGSFASLRLTNLAFRDPLKRPTRRPSLFVVTACLVASAAVFFGADQPLDSYLRQVESSYRAVKSWKADFVQVYRAGDRERRETGTVVLARGGRMRWDYTSPEPKLFIADGETTELYVPDEKQLMRTPEKSSEDYRAPFAILLARVNLHRIFGRIEDAGPGRILESATGSSPGQAGRVLRCFPKRADEGYDEVEVELTPALDVRRLVIQFSDRSVMEFTFDRIERNVSAPRSLFTFAPPPGTDVIDQPTGREP